MHSQASRVRRIWNWADRTTCKDLIQVLPDHHLGKLGSWVVEQHATEAQCSLPKIDLCPARVLTPRSETGSWPVCHFRFQNPQQFEGESTECLPISGSRSIR